MGYATINPYTNETLASFRGLSEAELEERVARADSASRFWAESSFPQRAKVVLRAAGMLREYKDDYARLLTLEMGKLYREALDEVRLSAEILEYYANNAEDFLAPETLSVASPDEGEARVVSEPMGVLLGIQPWNFPYYQLARFAAPNLMAGNVVLVKHASIVPQSAGAVERLFLEAGAPEGVYTNLYASKEQVNALIADDRVQGVALTGGEAAGAAVAGEAGKQLKKNTLELGGSDALIVLADADVDRTVEWARWGRMNNCGQSCVAAKRIIVVEELADEFLVKLRDALGALRAGDPFDEETTLPPLSSQQAADTVREQVREAVNGGATLISTGARVPERGAFVEPALLTDIDERNPVYDQEIFGPIAMFFRVRDEDEAVRLANDSSFGLGGSVFTSDPAHGEEVARRIHTGMVFVNHPTWTKADLPFGGTKHSGYGRELSEYGIHEFVNKKLINVVPIDGAP
ncbi:NAD-dependent succinate-semialdehyde dehydrogenase [Streptomyces sp. AJS327]|uniref:NAD-dependent succinate-semialdehyde dehydrogenase n=1 Tax=Streptomyces sp. AJS327 TaxID=2545265 RepID=UPI0015DFC678|nr:NAD-dependent succinate-semialdehyde dehydrogenase [Streptomyces sp. AJS327]MBA0049543.1 NAD-dependent succinate-semialdehyde dehydrogenase [Streptomyces sp. AJS327]